MPVIGIIIVYLLIKAALLGIGIGTGFLLRWLMPALDLGMCILIGVVATGIAVHFLARLLASVNEVDDEELKEEFERKTGRKVRLYALDAFAAKRRRRGRPLS
jgi:hypothetical protein